MTPSVERTQSKISFGITSAQLRGIPNSHIGVVAKSCGAFLRDIAAGMELAGDTSTLEDYAALAKLREEE